MLRFFVWVVSFFAERKEFFSSLSTNAGLVFLATLVLGNGEYFELGVVLTSVSMFLGFILSKGGK